MDKTKKACKEMSDNREMCTLMAGVKRRVSLSKHDIYFPLFFYIPSARATLGSFLLFAHSVYGSVRPPFRISKKKNVLTAVSNGASISYLLPPSCLASYLGRKFCLCRVSVRILALLGSLFTLHAGFDFSQLALTGQKLLSFLVNLTLHLELDFTQLLLFSAELFFLEADRLGSQVFRVHGRVMRTKMSLA